MDHEQAVASQAAERYVLGELSEQERDAFEEHFFECPECARDVRACAAFLANVRHMLREQEAGRREALRVRLGRKVLIPAALAAGLALAAFTVYLAAVRVPALEREIAALRAVQGYAAVFLRPVVRGEEQQITLPAGAQFLGLAADLPPSAADAAYHCELLEESGRPVAVLAVRAPARPGEPVHVLVPRAALRTGRYTLSLRSAAGAGAEVARFTFVIRVE